MFPLCWKGKFVLYFRALNTIFIAYSYETRELSLFTEGFVKKFSISKIVSEQRQWFVRESKEG